MLVVLPKRTFNILFPENVFAQNPLAKADINVSPVVDIASTMRSPKLISLKTHLAGSHSKIAVDCDFSS